MNQPRRLEVLSAIVEDYVHSREPVGSKALVERHNLGVSSATVRNDMAALEEEGMIAAPHASAGRIPTDKGYRAFVDRIASIKPLSAAERRAITGLLDSAEDLDQVMARTVRLLSQLTHQVAVVQYPVSTGETVRHVDLVGMAPGLVLVVLITSRGRVLQRVVDVERAPDEIGLAAVRAGVLDEARGQPLTELTAVAARAVDAVEPALRPAALTLAAAVADLGAGQREERLLMAGTSYLAQSTGDFTRSIAPILDALEEQVVMLRLLSEIGEDSRGVSVRIGRENAESPLADASVVATGYGPSLASKLGVVGPTRMDYPTTMSAVRAVARYLSRILHE
ncbi:heat-inducible transcriptional repressor HrcA [Rothia sp. AR01]|uniref:Heat-inducible transcription repressor HrcA n=1 Tax=Rothia santali TaxID=2949643 RepID=A0A9X2HGW0_9MICC|nr:heat-inducible transcriptional repressor HrcA [Rothia santali]MCP3424623.1 heat-inducible transcriptional repressor HrcA [Rothia santali]